jgi:hypothetical protein
MAAVVVSLVLAACQASSTPSPEPTPTVTSSPTPEVTATPVASASETPFATFTPWATDTPTPEPTPTPSPAPTPTPVPTPTSPASFCTGTASNQAFFVQAAHSVKFTVYCATALPAGWVIASGSWAGNSGGGKVTLTYRYRSTTTSFVVQEGAFCLTDALTCVGGPHPAAGSGTTNFDGMSAAFYSTTTGLMVAVAPGTAQAYIITSTGVSVATMQTIAANMKAVPKT